MLLDALAVHFHVMDAPHRNILQKNANGPGSGSQWLVRSLEEDLRVASGLGDAHKSGIETELLFLKAQVDLHPFVIEVQAEQFGSRVKKQAWACKFNTGKSIPRK